MKGVLSRFVPSHFSNPLGLALRVLRTGGAEGRFALMSVPMGILASPLDLALRPFERRLYERHTSPQRPLVLVCGPARSGTSIVAAALIRSLPVGYINNLMAVFPRSPLVANRLFHIRSQNEKVSLKSYYGRTSGFGSQNDGLFLWDRWLGADRTNPRPILTADAGLKMAAFWAAFEEHCQTSVIAKNNSLVTCASAVAEYLPNAHFLCLRREPIYLAQSLLIARSQIHGDSQVPYGLRGAGGQEDDPVQDVCQQVWFYEQAAQTQLEALGAGRFWTVPYEEFCQDPGALVHRVASQILGVTMSKEEVQRGLPSMTVSNRRRVSAATFERLADGLHALGVQVATDAVVDDRQRVN